MNRSPHLAIVQKAPLASFLLYFLHLGTIGFGGPIALASRMQSELVEERGWIERKDYLEGLSFAQLAPGHSPRNLPCIWATCGEACWVQRQWV